jgi:hypothetical protein
MASMNNVIDAISRLAAKSGPVQVMGLILAVMAASPAWAGEQDPATDNPAAFSQASGEGEIYQPSMEDILSLITAPAEAKDSLPQGWEEYGVIRHFGRKSVELLGEAGKKGKEVAGMAAEKGMEIAAEAGQKGMEVAGQAVEKGVEMAKKAEKIIDEKHDWFSGEVETTASLVDAYFNNENAAVEGNKSQVKLGLSVFYERGKDPQPGVGVDARIVLPRFEKRLHLILSGDSEEPSTGTAADSAARTSLPRVEDVPKTAALRYFLIALDTQNLSLDGGVNVKGVTPILFSSGRYRLHLDFHPWDMRFTQWVRWYTDTKWEETTRLELEKLLNESLLLRLAAENNWYQGSAGYYYLVRAELYHTLNPESVLQYSATLNGKTWPTNRITEPMIKAAHRRKMWREWFYVEGAVQATWPEERNYGFTPGVYLKIEGLFGNVPTKVGGGSK